MGFLICYSGDFFPIVLIITFSLLGFMRSMVCSLFKLMGFSDFLETQPYFQENPTRIPINPSMPATLIRQFLPVIKLSEADFGGEPPECCAVCLSELAGEEEIRWLLNCKHIFHRGCLDSWMDHNQMTCPLCRINLLPRHLQEEFDQRLRDASESVAQGSNMDYVTVDSGL